jgi:hypothetical protein
METLRDFDEAFQGPGGEGGNRGRRPGGGDESAPTRDPGTDARSAAREELVADAAEALWCYVIQREVCGFYGVEWVLREFDVPREVRLRMGPRTAR